jgi:hypothetical protein
MGSWVHGIKFRRFGGTRSDLRLVQPGDQPIRDGVHECRLNGEQIGSMRMLVEDLDARRGVRGCLFQSPRPFW